MTDSWLVLKKDCNYVGYGVYIGGELCVFDINIIENPRYWIVSIIDPDKGLTADTEYPTEDLLKLRHEFCGLMLNITVIRSDLQFDIRINAESIFPEEIT